MRIVVGITGASGVIYGIRLLDFLKNAETFLIISENAKQVIEIETGYDLKEIRRKQHMSSQITILLRLFAVALSYLKVR